ncbi:MAG: carbohydrate ABC transporter permease [Pseudomonadota bacterium]
MKRKTIRERGIGATAGLAVVAVFTLLPLFWMTSVSFMSPGEASAFPPPLLPRHPTLENYRALIEQAELGRYFVNSLFVASVATALSLTFNVAAGYAFAKLDFKGREAAFRLLLAALVIPAQVAMIPLFLMLKGMGLVNTWIGVLVPFFATIFGIFLVRQYALSIPTEMIEAARMEGASDIRIFRSVVLPSLSPILVTLGLFTFLGAWNDFFWPLIVLADSDKYTLPIAIAALSREHVQDVELMMAGAVVTVTPVLILFLALQRFYIQGLLVGSVKG